jgi:3-hydroxyisobutyrate dehydrogenase
MTTDLPRIAFLGLGTMGTGMARRLLGAGYPLTVYNRSPDKTGPLVSEGAKAARTPREAAADADIAITMVADDGASRSLWLGNEGIWAGARRGLLAVESSTVTPGWVAELAAAAQERGGELVDAPVTGSKAAAAGGQLNFLVGGPPAAVERLRPLLNAMGKTVAHLGPVGSGARMKLINNFLCGAEVAALAEALAMIERSDLNRSQALAILTDGVPGSLMIKLTAERMVKSNFDPQFALKLMMKDLRYASQEAERCGLSLLTAASALQRFSEAEAQGAGSKDISAIIEPLRQEAAAKA